MTTWHRHSLRCAASYRWCRRWRAAARDAPLDVRGQGLTGRVGIENNVSLPLLGTRWRRALALAGVSCGTGRCGSAFRRRAARRSVCRPCGCSRSASRRGALRVRAAGGGFRRRTERLGKAHLGVFVERLVAQEDHQTLVPGVEKFLPERLVDRIAQVDAQNFAPTAGESWRTVKPTGLLGSCGGRPIKLFSWRSPLAVSGCAHSRRKYIAKSLTQLALAASRHELIGSCRGSRMSSRFSCALSSQLRASRPRPPWRRMRLKHSTGARPSPSPWARPWAADTTPTRLVGRHLGKYIPGNRPSSQNIPGAGSTSRPVSCRRSRTAPRLARSIGAILQPLISDQPIATRRSSSCSAAPTKRLFLRSAPTRW